MDELEAVLGIASYLIAPFLKSPAASLALSIKFIYFVGGTYFS
jgi:hypothetical protein